MPLVRIDLPEAVADLAPPIGDAVHNALVATVDVPPADRFQVISVHGPGRLLLDAGFPNVSRSAGALIVQVYLRRGRSDQKKRALYRAIVANIAAATSLAPDDVMVVLSENDSADWSFGLGEAFYAPDPAPAGAA